MHLTPHQQTVLEAFKSFGKADDVALSVYIHHVADQSMSSSGVRTRRRELEAKGLVQVVGTKRTKSGRMAAIYDLTTDGKREVRKQRRITTTV